MLVPATVEGGEGGADAVADTDADNDAEGDGDGDNNGSNNSERLENVAQPERKRSHTSVSSSDEEAPNVGNGSMIANTSQNPLIELSPRNQRNPRQRQRLNAITNEEGEEGNEGNDSNEMVWDNGAHNTTSSLTPSFSTPVRGAEGGLIVDPIISTLSPPNPSMPVPLEPPMLDVENLVMSIRSIWKEDFAEHQGKVQDLINGMQEVNDKINSMESRLTELETRSKVAEDVSSEQGSQIERVTSVANEALSMDLNQ